MYSNINSIIHIFHRNLSTIIYSRMNKEYGDSSVTVLFIEYISYENELGYWPFTNKWLTADLRARMSKELLQHKGNRRSILIHNKYHKFAYSLFATALSYDNRVEIHYWQKQISRHSEIIFHEFFRILVYQKIYYCIIFMRLISYFF